MNCINCGAENAVDARFCKTCGERLGPPSKEIVLVSDPQEVPSPNPPPEPEGTYIINKRFRVLGQLGKGGMGEVLLAEDVKLKRNVAIKSILLKGSMEDTTSKLRFLREAQTASRLDHVNICTIYEVYEESNRDYIVMQYIDGITLDQITGAKKLGVEKITDIAIQVCLGMEEAHVSDIIHRDVKPGNIMVDKKGVVKILDFGLAKFSGDSFVRGDDSIDSNLTEKGYVLGTVAYISPEQARGKELDNRSDIFSFGVVLYEMIEGRNPFKEDEQIETLYNVLNKDIEFERDIPEELQRIVRKALEKDRDRRYQDFGSFRRDLQAFQTAYMRQKEQAKTQMIEQPHGPQTEIIDLDEQSKILKEVEKTTDKEDLGELVYRIKKSKASTERVMATQKSRRILRPLPMTIAAAALVIAAIVAYLLLSPTGAKEPVADINTYIYLESFENKTGDNMLPEMIEHLLMQSLNQFQEFRTIDKETVESLPVPDSGEKTTRIDRFAKHFKIVVAYRLSGKISYSKENDFYTIDARLKPYTGGTEGQLITATGKGRDSLLKNQVDLLTRGVYRNLYPQKAKVLKENFIPIGWMYGNRWDAFSNFFKGLQFLKGDEKNQAETYFLKSESLPISRYHLCHVYYFDGRRKQALKLIKKLLSREGRLTTYFKLRARAMAARLNFQFDTEVENWARLKDAFPFSKEAAFELGEAYFHHANPEEARRHYEDALKLDSHYSDALNHLGYCFAYMGQAGTAIEKLNQYRNLDVTANSFDSLGDGYYYNGDLDNAESMKLQAVAPSRDGSSIAYPYQTLTDIYILKAQYIPAVECINRYLALRHDQKDAEVSRKAEAYALSKNAFIDYLEERYEPAMDKLNKSLETRNSDYIKDSSAETHWLRGLVLLKLDKLEEAKKNLAWLANFKDKYKLDRENFDAALKYFLHLEALVLEKESQLDRAEENFKQLLDMKTRLSYWITYYHYQFFHTQYARFLARNHRYEDALTQIDICLEFNENYYIPAMWVKAGILEKLERPEEAKEVYRKISDLYSESDEQNRLRDLLKTKLN